jgi:hypothetical protein
LFFEAYEQLVFPGVASPELVRRFPYRILLKESVIITASLY